MTPLQKSEYINLVPYSICHCIPAIIGNGGETSSWRAFHQLWVQRLCVFIEVLRQERRQTLIFTPFTFTPINYHFNRPPEPGKTSQIPARWNYFSTWYIKQESLAERGCGGGGGGRGAEGEDWNTGEEINRRHLTGVQHLSSGELQEEVGL